MIKTFVPVSVCSNKLSTDLKSLKSDPQVNMRDNIQNLLNDSFDEDCEKLGAS